MASDPDWKSRRILIIDQDEAFRVSVRALLRQRQVLEISSAPFPLDAHYILCGQPVDLVLLEVPYNPAPAWALLRWMRESKLNPCSETRVVLTFRHLDKAQLKIAMALGVHGVLRKPIGPEPLLQAMTEALTVRPAFSGHHGRGTAAADSRAADKAAAAKSAAAMAPPDSAVPAAEQAASPVPGSALRPVVPAGAEGGAQPCGDGAGSAAASTDQSGERRSGRGAAGDGDTSPGVRPVPVRGGMIDCAGGGPDAPRLSSGPLEVAGLPVASVSGGMLPGGEGGAAATAGAAGTAAVAGKRAENRQPPLAEDRSVAEGSAPVSSAGRRSDLQTLQPQQAVLARPVVAEASASVLAASVPVAAGLVSAGGTGGAADSFDLAALLAAHAQWVGSRGQNGTRLLLEDRDLRGQSLAGAVLVNAGLRGCDLSGCDLAGCLAHGADLRGAFLSGAQLAGADLSVARLRHASLRGCQLAGANLRGADLAGADLSGVAAEDCAVQGAILLGARLDDADFSQATGLHQSQVNEAQGNSATRLPAGVRLTGRLD